MTPTPSNQQRTNHADHKFIRRLFWTVAAAVGGHAIFSLFNQRDSLRINRVTIPIKNLPDALDGYTIGHLSDVHRGPFISEDHIRRAVQMVMSLNADLIVVTGDFVFVSHDYAASCAKALSDLKARDGVYGVLGNHDYKHKNVHIVKNAIIGAGIKLLVNRSVKMQTKGVAWWLCGVDDMIFGKPDLDEALKETPKDAFKILMAHEPDYVDHAAKYDIPLQLSGHSHGGQVVLPFFGRLVLPRYGQKYIKGLERVPNTETQIYTNVGTGVVGVPYRINCPPEVALLTLTKT